MAIYHLSVKAISRKDGRSSTAAAAYRAGEGITDERTGEIHDYRRKSGIESAEIVLPCGAPKWACDRSKLWNAAEQSEKRKDACVAREFEVALPAELSSEERRQLAVNFAKEMANRERCAVDVCIHAPRDDGDIRNHHAHILRTTRKIEAEGMGEKLDTEKSGRNRKADLEEIRQRWEEMTNAALERAGQWIRIDRRSLAKQGIARDPGRHLGPRATAIERKTKQPSHRREDIEVQAKISVTAKARIPGVAEVAAGIVGFRDGYEAHMAEKAAREAQEARERQKASEATMEQQKAAKTPLRPPVETRKRERNNDYDLSM